MRVINNAISQLAGEATKFLNIPAVASRNANSAALDNLENRLTGFESVVGPKH